MLWVIIVLIIAIISTALSTSLMALETFVLSMASGAVIALALNLGLSLLPDKTETTSEALVGPVTIEQVGPRYDFVYRTSTGVHFDNSVNLTIAEGTERKVSTTDYIVHNGWLSMFNWKPDSTVITLPATETIRVVR